MLTGLLAEILICIDNSIHLKDRERLIIMCCWLLYLMEKDLILEISGDEIQRILSRALEVVGWILRI